jgi:hypothetical protein
MNYDDLPLSACVVECDGSACGSGPAGWHTHRPQDGGSPAAYARVENGRVTYLDF